MQPTSPTFSETSLKLAYDPLFSQVCSPFGDWTSRLLLTVVTSALQLLSLGFRDNPLFWVFGTPEVPDPAVITVFTGSMVTKSSRGLSSSPSLAGTHP